MAVVLDVIFLSFYYKFPIEFLLKLQIPKIKIKSIKIMNNKLS